MKKDYLAIDLGTDNTIIYSSQTDSVVYSEPTCIAFDSLSHAVKDIGFLASKISLVSESIVIYFNRKSRIFIWMMPSRLMSNSSNDKTYFG